MAGQHLADGERLAQAAAIYRRAAELAPHEYEMVFNAANILRQAAKNDEAEHYYRIAVRLRPNVRDEPGSVTSGRQPSRKRDTGDRR